MESLPLNCDLLLPMERFPTGTRSKKKPCCVCKMTKKFRDSCIRNNEEEVCFDFVQAHKMCLKAKGFRID